MRGLGTPKLTPKQEAVEYKPLLVKSPGACKILGQVLGEILQAPMSNEGWMNILLWYFLVGRIVMRLVMSSQTLDFSWGVRCCVTDG